MDGITFQAAIDFDFSKLASIFTAGFQGYFVKIELTALMLELICRTESSDLSSGLVAIHHNQPVGILMLARRGWTSRIHAMGVIPEYRGQGVGRLLLEQCIASARERGDKFLKLEVIAANTQAQHLYAARGFQVQQKLVGFQRTSQPDSFHSAHILQTIDTLEFAHILRLECDVLLPWQLQPETLGSYVAPTHALGLDNKAFVLLSHSNNHTTSTIRGLIVRKDFRGLGWGTKLLQTLFTQYPNRAWNFSPIFPDGLMNGFLQRHDFTLNPIEQFEMWLECT